MLEGARLAASLEPDLVLFDGSGAALPPIAAGRRVLVVGAHQDVSVATGYLNTYRALIADLVVVTMAEEETRHAELAAALRQVTRPGVPVIRTTLRPVPAEAVRRRAGRVLRHRPGRSRSAASRRSSPTGTVRTWSTSRGPRRSRRLREELATLDAETFVVELKAAAVDVVAVEAQRGVPASCSPPTRSCRSRASRTSMLELERLAAEAIAGLAERGGRAE